MSQHFGGAIVFLEGFLLGRAARDNESHLKCIAPGFPDGFVIGPRRLSDPIEFGNVAFEAKPPNAEGGEDCECENEQQKPGMLFCAPFTEMVHPSRKPQWRLAASFWDWDQQGQNDEGECGRK